MGGVPTPVDWNNYALPLHLLSSKQLCSFAQFQMQDICKGAPGPCINSTEAHHRLTLLRLVRCMFRKMAPAFQALRLIFAHDL